MAHSERVGRVPEAWPERTLFLTAQGYEIPASRVETHRRFDQKEIDDRVTGHRPGGTAAQGNDMGKPGRERLRLMTQSGGCPNLSHGRPSAPLRRFVMR